MILSTIAAIILSSAIFYAAYFMLKKKTGGTLTQDIEQRAGAIKQVRERTSEILAAAANLGSKAHYENLVLKLEETKTNLQKERDNLKQVEAKLDNVQKTVEGKEAEHQEMKTTKEENEGKLAELLSQYETISAESIELEQQLAESMKSLDSIMESLPADDNQKAILQELSDTLTNSGSRMRDLLTEYNMVKERLDALSQQHSDLEEEYTRLVEQQLGE